MLVRVPWEVAGLPGRYSMFGHHGHAGGAPFKWRFAGGSMMARFKWYLGSSVPPSARGSKQKRSVKYKTFWVFAVLREFSASEIGISCKDPDLVVHVKRTQGLEAESYQRHDVALTLR